MKGDIKLRLTLFPGVLTVIISGLWCKGLEMYGRRTIVQNYPSSNDLLECCGWQASNADHQLDSFYAKRVYRVLLFYLLGFVSRLRRIVFVRRPFNLPRPFTKKLQSGYTKTLKIEKIKLPRMPTKPFQQLSILSQKV